MGLETVKNALLTDARKEADGQVRTAEKEVEAQLQAAREEAARSRKETEGQVARTLENDRQEREAWSHLEVQRVLAEAREDAVRTAMEEIYDALGGLRAGTAYTNYLKHSLQTAMEELGTEIIVHIRKEDGKKLKVAAKTTVRTDGNDPLGGLWAETRDGRIRYNATLTHHMEMQREVLRKRIYEKLFRQKTVTERGKKYGKAVRKRD